MSAFAADDVRTSSQRLRDYAADAKEEHGLVNSDEVAADFERAAAMLAKFADAIELLARIVASGHIYASPGKYQDDVDGEKVFEELQEFVPTTVTPESSR